MDVVASHRWHVCFSCGPRAPGGRQARHEYSARNRAPDLAVGTPILFGAELCGLTTPVDFWMRPELRYSGGFIPYAMTKIGIIGCGFWGSKHVRSMYDLGVEKLLVCDSDAARLSGLQRKYPGVTMTTEFDQVLESDVAGIIIATPMSTHYPLAKQALLSGKDVLVEKPLTTRLAEAEELVELAERRQSVLMVGHTFVYNPAVDAVRQLIADGELGDIYYLDSARLNLGVFQHDASVLWDLAPHDLSMLMYMLDAVPLRVSAWGAAHVNRRLLDNAHLDLIFPNETRAHVHVSWLEPCKVRRATVVGTRKMVVFDDVAATEKVWVYDKGVTLQFDTDDFEDFHLSYRYGHTTILHTSAVEPLHEEQRHFIECVEERRRPRSDGFAGTQVVALLECVEHSIANRGASVDVTWVDPRPGPDLGSGLRFIVDVRHSGTTSSNGVVHALAGDRS